MEPLIKTVEEVAGNYHYHIKLSSEKENIAICGATRIMRSGSRMEDWNMEPTHIRYAFCKICTAKAKALGFKIPDATPNTLTFAHVKR